MRIARVDKETNVVVNMEIADQEWVNENMGDTQFWFFPCEEESVFVGSAYDKQLGTFVNQEVQKSAEVPTISNDEEFLNVDDGGTEVFVPPTTP